MSHVYLAPTTHFTLESLVAERQFEAYSREHPRKNTPKAARKLKPVTEPKKEAK